MIFYDAAANTLNINTERSSLGEGAKVIESAPLTLAPGEPLLLRVFIDKSFVESTPMIARPWSVALHPTRPDSLGVALIARGGDVTVPQMQAWEMMPSNPY